MHEPIWIHIPHRYKSKVPGTSCLHLKKSLYGTNLVHRLWFLHLVKFLWKDGSTWSKTDECLLFTKDMSIFLCMVDCGVTAPSMQLLDDFVECLHAGGFEFAKEGDFLEYLGIKFTSNCDTNTITMSQPGLTKKIIKTTSLTMCNPNCTSGPPFCEQWQYSSVVGMLLYLSTNTQLDISFTVSQVCCFTCIQSEAEPQHEGHHLVPGQHCGQWSHLHPQ